ncbi:UPF0236 family transposase-like protein [Lactovum miscens]|uniref:Uncharacterized protein n=1 Tax=Lactovum miscens TaxID=190387 RepID=A0A841C8N1_9LACT|nr:UPF0236 family protein [Lactovum miscens]MBB5887580.1 hypothetical protein [Lactovum miscens]
MNIRKMMDQKVINESNLASQFKDDNLQGFYKIVQQYDEYIYPIMKANGWKPILFGVRTVMFTFGDTSFSRRGYKKDGVWCYPVDNKLGLSHYERHSKGLMFQIAKLSTIVTYCQVVEIVQMMYNLVINHETVRKAVQQAHKLQVEFDEYRYYQDHAEQKKIKAPFLYIEGDGVMVKTTIGDNKRTDLAHFVIHIYFI